MDRPEAHTWGARPSEFITVREKADVHNISQDSGLSHSPIQQEVPQLTIGRPIGHIDLPPKQKHGKKEKKWKIGGLFRRRSKEIKSSDLPSDSKHSLPSLPERNASFQRRLQSEQPPPRPPKSSNVFQPSLAVRGGGQQVFLPHLRADLQYPDQPLPVTTGYYYDPRFGYVRSGSYYDQQIMMLRGEEGRVAWRDQKQNIMRTAEKRRSLLEESSESEEETGETPVMRRTGSVGSLSRRSRGARTERYLSRRPANHSHSPYIHTAGSDSHSTPPPPPPRDHRLRQSLLSSMRGRPVSSSFEHLRVPSSLENLKSPLRQQNSQPLPPRRPHSNSSDLTLGITRQSAVASPASVQSQPSSLENYVDPTPRSRRPIIYQAAGSVASSEGIGGSQTSLEDGNYYLGSVASVRHVPATAPCPPTVNTQIPAKYKHNSARDPSYSIESQTTGISSPNSISSKDSGCSGSYDIQSFTPLTKPPATSCPALTSVREIQATESSDGSETAVNKIAGSADQNTAAGFSTQKRRSRFEEAIKELEMVYNNIANDEDLLDRAERRDLPTAHQLLIWRERDSDMSHNTSAESGVSDFDNFMNWNTSSSFEQLPGRTRTPSNRTSFSSDKTLDDMAYRRISAANKVPSSLANISELSNQSYLAITTALSPSCSDTLENTHDQPDSDEPDIRIDDVLFRNIRDANKIKIIEPQPKFGIPLGPITGGANSDYLHAVPEGKYRSTFNSMRNPDLVKDDLAFRHLRKDENQCDPSHLGIVKDPHGLIVSSTNWPPKKETYPAGAPFVYYPNKHNPIMRSLSENIAQIVRKQSSRPGARLDDIITYEDLSSPVVYDSIKYTMDLITKESLATRPDVPVNNIGEGGNTVYDLLRHHSEPDNINTVGLQVEEEKQEGLEEEEQEKEEEEEKESVTCSSAETVSDEISQSCQDVCSNEGGECDGEQRTESQAIRVEEVKPTEIIINSCLIQQNRVDLSTEKEKLFQKPNFMASFVEDSKMIDLKTLSDGLEIGSENISEDDKEEEDDNEEENDKEEEDEELEEVCNIDNEGMENPSSIKGESESQVDYEFPKSVRSESRQSDDEELGVKELLGQMSGLVAPGSGSEGGKLSGEEVISLLSHPGNLVIAIMLACLHSVTGLDLLTVFSLLLTVVSFVSLIFQ